ncbi:T-cell surface glycoprotein CD3 zeta chain [Collichthys lucidus]|uniref:T-cell surface glycoprotein CD3 zeta chain n=1 Tax=Collichthys lucidus TaxID=240159 RepID=A0A4U5TVH4_COLLU|nr:T-cell surface glycoprotein CD3 zeta chain [Collichthys lucidus]
MLRVWTCEGEALALYDPQLCYILDGFLGLYGLVITGMFIKEKFFRTRVKTTDEGIYSDLQGQDSAGYAPLMRGDPERGRNRRVMDDNATYTQRQRKTEKVYQDLSSATKDTYDSLQMKPLPAR